KDDIPSLAAEFNIYSWQIVKYNEFDKREKLSNAQIVYLEKKRRRSNTHETHILREGESIHAVSQLYGIRLKRLYKLNDIDKKRKVLPGSVLRLR
ncbi:MAG: LysM domain-containing protein, partial [Bacteroidales bacterium]|nr:LysM domain-containing protein [Bacteroidales bacterium]